MKFIDWFAGIGGFRRGMELAGHECVGFCEFDKYAVASYTSMHLITERERERLSTLDLRKRQKEILKEEYRHGEWYESDVVRVHAGDIPRADCWCFGFPCQDISVAGKQKGFEGNRSSLFFRITGLLRDLKEEDRPSTLFIENVRNLLSINRGYDFARLLVELDSIGYDAEWEVLNSKDFGIPQNRERCFIIGHLRSRGGREVFPLRRDAEQDHILEEQKSEMSFVDMSYDSQLTDIARCIKARQYEGIQHHKGCSSGVLVPFNAEDDGTSRTIKYQYQKNSVPNFMDRGDRGATAVAVPVLTPDRLKKRQNGRRFKENGDPMFTLTAQDKHGVLIREATAKGYTKAEEEEDSINFSVPGSETRRGRVGKGIANTLDTGCQQGIFTGYRIRRLTPKECFRLQGWTDDYFEKAQFVNSDCQLYKQAGNGVTVNVIYEIARRFEEEKDS